MATENSLITTKTVDDLRGGWGLAMGGTVAASAIATAAGAFIPFAGMIVGGPFALGVSYFSLAYARGEQARFEQVFDGWKKFEQSCPLYIVRNIFIFLWTLLLIIPGIIAGINYSQAFYLLADEPDLKVMDALKKSKEMMQGHKMRYFGLCMRMFGWALLCLLTFGIGFLWLMPYSAVAFANFYDDLNPQGKEFDVTDHLV